MSFAKLSTPGTKLDLSEHNRAPLSVTPERIESKQRMHNGRMRSWHTADKRTWSTSWSDIPHDSTKTVDGKMGAQEMEAFYDANPGEFIMYIRLPDGQQSTHYVMFSEFSKTISKRGVYEFWNIDLAVEEV
jgi:hypothetical protein